MRHRLRERDEVAERLVAEQLVLRRHQAGAVHLVPAAAEVAVPEPGHLLLERLRRVDHPVDPPLHGEHPLLVALAVDVVIDVRGQVDGGGRHVQHVGDGLGRAWRRPVRSSARGGRRTRCAAGDARARQDPRVRYRLPCRRHLESTDSQERHRKTTPPGHEGRVVQRSVWRRSAEITWSCARRSAC